MLFQPSRRRATRPACGGLSAVLTLALALILAALAFSAGAAHAADYVPHEVLVGYTPRATTGMSAAIRTGLGARAVSAPAPRSELLHLPKTESVSRALARLRRQPGVAYAEPNYIARAAGAWFPDDVGRTDRAQGWEKLQWNLLPAAGINAPTAWANMFNVRRPGGRGVIVAIIDTGVAYRDWHQFHQSPDFRGTHFVAPYDFVSGNRYPLDRNGHGTFVAGVVGESTNNNVGLTGIAYGASIMPIRVLDAGGLGDETTIARGIRYAVNRHAQVINLSLEFLPTQVSSGSAIPEIVSAINFAHRRGVTVVGAAGNDQTDQIAYPARVGSVISVGATTRDRCLADYSNGGTGLDLVAPGGGDDAIMSSDPNCHPERDLPSIYQLTLTAPHWGRFEYPDYYIGTSMSAPEVAATAALVIASGVIGRHPSPDQILGRLEQTAAPLGTGQPNSEYGYGLLDAGAATSTLVQATRH
jgi:serine protease